MDTNKNEELQSRREFFKSAAKAALPVIEAVVLSQLPLTADAVTGCNACSGSCKNSCDKSCVHTCINTCAGDCRSACKGTCKGACKNWSKNAAKNNP